MLIAETLGLQLMFGAAIFGAGLVGAATLFLPRLAGKYVFAGETTVDRYIRILGALWLALGLVAILGVTSPSNYWPILLLQLIYKTIWLMCVAVPAIARGNRETGLIFFAALFSIWVVALILFVPFPDLILSHGL